MSFDFEERGLALKRALEIALKPKAWEADLDGEALHSKFDVSEAGFYVDDEAPALPPRSPIDEMNEMDEILGITCQSKRKRGSDAKLLAEAQKFSRLLNSNSFKFKESTEKETVSVAKKVKTENRGSRIKEINEEVVFDWKFKLQTAFLGKTQLTTKDQERAHN
ncbi:hypothetical protein CROQUDRAFT_651388 [Cronartium quercuum f. sp. fusiforme G11]|uniref:Uncharacterized protein n=1 Tax=Cronartium quercuum f. sp. fusiforme G11 TaxID=708437 RepID=A0A9P6TGW9_9BASI|nr:hypothetical protein CROQUDRAFT_651388 [Cronartium quercuum f. sp. fusiforme G11]